MMGLAGRLLTDWCTALLEVNEQAAPSG